MTKSYLYVLGLIAVAVGVARAITEDEINSIRTAIWPLLETCGQEFGVTKEQILAAKKAGTLNSLDSCFYACFFKKCGNIDANGLFDANATLEKNKKYIKSEEDLAKIAEIGKTCSSVNDHTVSDGAKGCERSKLLVSCFLKEKAHFLPFASSA